MKKVLLLLLFCHTSSQVKHSLKFYFTGSFGIPNIPKFVGAVEVDQIQAAYCDSNKKTKPKQDWVKKVIKNDREQLDWYKEECFVVQPNFFKTTIENLMQRFDQRGGVHILQRMSGCEWDDETGEVNGFMHYGYDGEDFISLDVKNLSWVALKPRGVATKLSWDADRTTLRHYENYLTQICPQWLKKYVDVARSSLLRKADGPSHTKTVVIVFVVVIFFAILAVVGFICYKKHRAARPSHSTANDHQSPEDEPMNK